MKNDIQWVLKDFINCELYISPWFAPNSSSARFDAGMFIYVDRIAKDVVAKYWTESEMNRAFGELPLMERLPRTAVYEILASTGMIIGHEIYGDFEVSKEVINIAMAKLLQFISKHGLGMVVKIFHLVTFNEDALALYFYGSIPERIFIMGSWHRPWMDYSLSEELFWGSMTGNYRIEILDGQRYVHLTDQGREKLLISEQILKESGYLELRVKLLPASHEFVNLYYKRASH